ncbi:unnamed protein product [Amoebophrya sp. A25]|nr:unnamed protein product [Amoebophrya sp. A25]|eukprot:GSA25T00024807001.1
MASIKCVLAPIYYNFFQRQWQTYIFTREVAPLDPTWQI